MGVLRAVSLFVFLIATALSAGVVLGGHALASGSPFLRTFEAQASTISKDGCMSETAGNHSASQAECCQGMNCAHSGVMDMTLPAMPALLLFGTHDPGVEDHISGRTITPDTGPPKLLA